MKTILKTIFTIIALTLTISAQAIMVTAQDYHDTVKVYVGYSTLRSEPILFLGINLPIKESQGITGTVDYKLLGNKAFRASGLFEFSTKLDNSTTFHQYSAGSQLSYNLFDNKVSPFFKTTLGIHRVLGTNNFLKQFGVGVDLNIGEYLFIRPVGIDKQYIDGFKVATNRFTAGLGFKIK